MTNGPEASFQGGFPPIFATNDPTNNEKVADAINLLLSGSRKELVNPPDVAIASAYINPSGFELIADELEKVPHVRLLFGAEPEQGVTKNEVSSYADDQEWLSSVLSKHDQWMKVERDLTGFTKQSDAATKRLVAWLDSKTSDDIPKVSVRRYVNGFLHGKALIIEHDHFPGVLAGSANFTFAGLSLNRELNLGYPQGTHNTLVRAWFDKLWAESEEYPLADLYRKRWEPHSPWLIFLRMLYELYGETDNDAEVTTGLSLTSFQRDGVARMIRLLEQNSGVLVADEVGLGKTYLAGEVIMQASKTNRQSVLVICPAAIQKSVWEPFLKYHDFSRKRVDVYSYDQLRLKYEELCNDHDPERAKAYFDDYALVVIDEAHNLRNPSALRSEAITSVLGGPNPKKVVLLTATPVNNSLYDLHTLISYFIKNDGTFAHLGIPSIKDYIKSAQQIDPESLSPTHLFDLMDQVAVRRTRQFVKKNYLGDQVTLESGKIESIKFPVPNVYRIDYRLSQLGFELLQKVVKAIEIKENEDLVSSPRTRQPQPGRLRMARYTASAYLISGDLESYQVANSGLLRSALLKRLESSPEALSNTLGKLILSHKAFLRGLDQGKVLSGEALVEWSSSSAEDLDDFLSRLDEKAMSQVLPVASFDISSLRKDVESDLELLIELKDLADQVCMSFDTKADKLIEQLRSIAAEAVKIDGSGMSDSNRRKTVIFSSFADTVKDLHQRVQNAVETASDSDPLSKFKGRIAPAIFGSKGGTNQKRRALEIANFAPETAGELKEDGTPKEEDLFDLLFATDVLSEGVNLQQAGRVINYDLPWNPMRLVQRSGRIDRIGSKHDYIYIGCFFPADVLNELLHLEETLMRKLAYADAAIGTGTVLPGQISKIEVVLSDTRDQIEQLLAERADLFEKSDNSAALSGEEYRKTLTKSLSDPRFKSAVLDLPYGSGSGFVNPNAKSNGYVFCIKMGSHPKPWFRWVPTDKAWNPTITVEPNGQELFDIDDDTLVSLIHADPKVETTPRHLLDLAYEKAFAAWEVASADAHNKWIYLSDPNNLMPDVEKTFRDAAQLIYKEGGFLGDDIQGELAAKLSGRWSTEIKSAVREILSDESLDSRSKIEKLKATAEEFGLTVAPPPKPLPQLQKHDVRLITWMAVSSRHMLE